MSKINKKKLKERVKNLPLSSKRKIAMDSLAPILETLSLSTPEAIDMLIGMSSELLCVLKAKGATDEQLELHVDSINNYLKQKLSINQYVIDTKRIILQ